MKKNAGQTFVEVVVVVSLVVLVITALVSGSIASLKTTRYNSAKSQATKYAQEGVELARKDRDSSWNTFYNRRNLTYCLDKAGTWTQGATCPVNIDGIFTRTLDFVAINNGMEVTVTVSWIDGSTNRSSKIQTFFTQWQ